MLVTSRTGTGTAASRSTADAAISGLSAHDAASGGQSIQPVSPCVEIDECVFVTKRSFSPVPFARGAGFFFPARCVLLG